MSISFAEQRQIENEKIFRRDNEKVINALDTLDVMHAQDGHFDLTRGEDLELHFVCECSDENCTSRIPLSLAEYRKVHRNRNVYIVMPNHQVDSIEKVIQKTPLYTIVKKFKDVGDPRGELNATSINNS